MYWKDLGERVGWTFIQAFLAALPVAIVGADVDTAKGLLLAAVVAGGGAVLSLLKGLAARRVGLPDSASTAKNV